MSLVLAYPFPVPSFASIHVGVRLLRLLRLLLLLLLLLASDAVVSWVVLVVELTLLTKKSVQAVAAQEKLRALYVFQKKIL